MRRTKKDHNWYPPAETKVSLKALIKGFNGSEKDAEKALCELTGSAYCQFGHSGRGLLYCLLKALKEKHNSLRNEVLLPGYTCYSVAAAAVKAGLKIRLYDLDPKTLNPNNSSLESNCGRQTLAVLSQHLFGIPTDISELSKIAKLAGAYHIEDAAQAFGGIFQDKRSVGTHGDFGLFSFGRGKPLPLGGGGALISLQYPLKELLPSFDSIVGLNTFGITTAIQLMAHPHLYGITELLPIGLGKTIFDPQFKVGGINKSLAGLLVSMIDVLPKLNTHRELVSTVYRETIAPEFLMSVAEGKKPVYHRFPVLAKEGELPATLYQSGARRLYPSALNQQPEIAVHITNANQVLVGSELLAKQLITLPTHHSIDEKIARTIACDLNHWVGG